MFEIRDYRNARYQGETKNGLPNGLGIIIDYNYLFCLAEWSNGMINGAVFAVFPDSRIFCGRLHNNQLSGVCTFYLQDKIQMFANYSQRPNKMKNFIAVLPFCKVILQIDRNGSQPKAIRHETYNLQGNSLSNKLNSIIGQQVDLTEYNTWRDYLITNFINAYPKKLYWKQNFTNKVEGIFIGLKYEGLGVEIISFIQQKEIIEHDDDCFIIASMGSYSNLQGLKGLGRQLVDYSKYKMQEEGIFGDKTVDSFQYPRKNRPIKGQKNFVHQLKSSINFNNTFFDLRIFYDMGKKYEKINVQIMEENRKIAQIVIQQKDDSVILAQIQNKKQRRLTPQRSQRAIQSEYQRIKQPTDSKISFNYKQRAHEYDDSINTNSILSVNPQTKKSIYSSAEKVRKYKNSPKKKSDITLQRYEPVQYQDYESPSFQKFSPQRSTNQSYKNYNDSLDKSNGSLSKIKSSKKYLYQAILDDPNSLKAGYLKAKEQNSHSSYLDTSHYKPKSNYHSRESDSYMRNLKYEGTIKQYSKQKEKYTKQRPNYNNRKLSSNYQKQYKQQSPPLLNRYHNHKQLPIIPKKTSKEEDQDLINFFNKQFDDINPYAELNKAVIYDEPMSNKNWTLGTTPKRQKTPGKIVTFKKRNDASIYQ